MSPPRARNDGPEALTLARAVRWGRRSSWPRDGAASSRRHRTPKAAFSAWPGSTTSTSSTPALSYYSPAAALLHRPARGCSITPTGRASSGHGSSPKWCTDSGSRGRPYVHVRVEANLPIPHGRAGDGTELRRAFNRNADSRMHSPATSYMHEIAGADAVASGEARTISGCGCSLPTACRSS